MDKQKNDDSEAESIEKPPQYINLPQKSKYRTHSHCNPLSIVSIPYPFAPNCVDWTDHYPLLLENSKSKNASISINTNLHPIHYHNEKYLPIATSNIPQFTGDIVKIVDIGCGYGGLLFNMSETLPKGTLAIGMEIREKVTNYAGEKIKTMRINTHHEKYNNISVVRSNTMKLLLNYFYKGQLEKIFFCFPDPHFKRYNHRKRIINKYLLNDYSYLLKKGGLLYTITDVEELHKWNMNILRQNRCFKELSPNEVEMDKFTEFMKNTDEAKKVIKKEGKMYYSVYKRVDPQIKSLHELYDLLDVSDAE